MTAETSASSPSRINAWSTARRARTSAIPRPIRAETASPAAERSGLIAALDGLNERQRMAVVLCYFEEHSNPQAAQMMGLHIKALEGLLVRARKQLRGWLGKYREEP